MQRQIADSRILEYSPIWGWQARLVGATSSSESESFTLAVLVRLKDRLGRDSERPGPLPCHIEWIVTLCSSSVIPQGPCWALTVLCWKQWQYLKQGPGLRLSGPSTPSRSSCAQSESTGSRPPGRAGNSYHDVTPAIFGPSDHQHIYLLFSAIKLFWINCTYHVLYAYIFLLFINILLKLY